MRDKYQALIYILILIVVPGKALTAWSDLRCSFFYLGLFFHEI
ncbi:MAG: hypothetical protein ACI8XC_003241 [Gammaproteobacteria bacterium]|jgi:hypothetical protein